MSYAYDLPLDYSISEILPNVLLDFPLDYAIVKGAAILAKRDGVLAEYRVWVKVGGQLIDAGA